MTREQQRDELHKAIWKIANDLRGSIDGWDFKNYVLGILFYRYISENFTLYINAGEAEAGDTDFNYADLSDDMIDEETKKELIETKGFFIYPSQLFENVLKNAEKDENLNVTLSDIFRDIENSAMGAASEEDMKGLFSDIDVNSIKLGGTVAERNKLLAKLLKGIGDMNLSYDFTDNNIDAFGDAYEYLIGMYAANAGKSGGEYFTPQEVSRLLVLLATHGKTEINKIYDCCSGSGSMLLQAAKILGKENVRIGYFGQEKNPTSYNLCRINMWLHDIGYDKFDIARGDTLIDPQHWDDEPFEAIVTNMPYSIAWEGDDNPLLINDSRFSPAGVLAPKSKADWAFAMHCLSWLAPDGVSAIVCFPGIFYRGGAEKKIRKYMVDNNFIDCIIQLPENLFFGTSIATCVMVMKKSKSDSNVLFIDASKECIKVTNDNKLTEENIQNILRYYVDREDKEYISKVVSIDEIKEEEYNLSVSTYVEKEDTKEVIDIDILNTQIKEIVAQEEALRTKINAVIAEIDELFATHENCSHIGNLVNKFCPEGVEYKKLNEIGTLIRGKRFVHADAVEKDGIPCVHYGELYTYYGIWTKHTKSQIRKDIGKKLRYANKNDVIIVGAGENDIDIGIAVAYLGDNPVAVHDACYILTHNEDAKYISYCLRTNDYHKRLKKYVSRGKICAVSAENIGKISIPIPPIEVQREIVKILDTFDNLCNDNSSGLPAEIAARKKQYEYYRDKLLTFNVLEANHD